MNSHQFTNLDEIYFHYSNNNNNSCFQEKANELFWFIFQFQTNFLDFTNKVLMT